MIRDSQPPTVVFNTALDAPPLVNTVTQMPYPLSGTVTDSNLAGATINSNNIDLLPGAANNEYTFEVNLSLPNNKNKNNKGQTTIIVIN